MCFVLLLRSAFGDHNVPHHSSIILLFGKSTWLFLFVANAHSNWTCGFFNSFELNLHDMISYYSNRFGQVGTGSSAEQVLSLTKIETHFKPIQIACGDFHSAAVTVSQLPKREYTWYAVACVQSTGIIIQISSSFVVYLLELNNRRASMYDTAVILLFRRMANSSHGEATTNTS